ncbi:MAG TPA: preprotein translocase subunit YajC [Acidimicrobiales bacterium]
MEALIVLAVTLGLTWVLFILPQQRRIKEHKATVASLQVGDEVMTTAGLFGTVVALDDEIVTLEVAPGTALRFARGAIGQRVDDDVAAEPTGTDEPSESSESNGSPA